MKIQFSMDVRKWKNLSDSHLATALWKSHQNQQVHSIRSFWPGALDTEVDWMSLSTQFKTSKLVSIAHVMLTGQSIKFHGAVIKACDISVKLNESMARELVRLLCGNWDDRVSLDIVYRDYTHSYICVYSLAESTVCRLLILNEKGGVGAPPAKFTCKFVGVYFCAARLLMR